MRLRARHASGLTAGLPAVHRPGRVDRPRDRQPAAARNAAHAVAARPADGPVQPPLPRRDARARGRAYRALGPITVSIGLATMPQHGETPQALMQAADAPLY